MKEKKSSPVGLILLILLLGFVMFALSYSKSPFVWKNGMIYAIFLVYTVFIVGYLIVAASGKLKKK